MIFILLALISWPLSQAVSGPAGPMSYFNHEAHVKKVFKEQNIACSACHNFSVDAQGKVQPGVHFESTALNRPLATICHDCHKNKESKNLMALKSCQICHRSDESMGGIKPQNHWNINWKEDHRMAAKTDGESCLGCHLTSNCVKCHLKREDIELNNHTRNFRFFHSVDARERPHRCASCHSRSFCVDCHLGRNP